MIGSMFDDRRRKEVREAIRRGQPILRANEPLAETSNPGGSFVQRNKETIDNAKKQNLEPFMHKLLLGQAIYEGDLQGVKDMVRLGADINARDNAGVFVRGKATTQDMEDYLDSRGAVI
jgi:hypothetical protein